MKTVTLINNPAISQGNINYLILIIPLTHFADIYIYSKVSIIFQMKHYISDDTCWAFSVSFQSSMFEGSLCDWIELTAKPEGRDGEAW